LVELKATEALIGEQTSPKALRIYTYAPIQASAAIQPIEESTIGSPVWLSRRIAYVAALAPGLKVGGHAFRDVKKLFVVSLWHLVSLLVAAAL
jgi:hypothetical protein